MRTVENGFTIAELIVVIAVVAVLATLGASKYSSMSTQARRSACIDSQAVIDRTVRVWEHRNRDLPPGASLTFDMNGNVTASSGLGGGPAPSGADIRKLASSEDLFVCPERMQQLGGRQALNAEARAAENDFTWMRSANPEPRLNNSRAGAYCIFFVDTGPDQTEDTRHR